MEIPKNMEIPKDLERRLKEGAQVRDLLQMRESLDAVFVHPDSEYGFAEFDALRQLTETGQEDYAALLDAQVTAIRQDMWGLELEITGVDPQGVTRFYDAYEAHMEAEQAMGPLM